MAWIEFSNSSPPRDRCPCCTDDGQDGARDWKSTGHCQICRESGCQDGQECKRPPTGSLYLELGPLYK